MMCKYYETKGMGMKEKRAEWRQGLAGLAALGLLGGCATSPAGAPAAPVVAQVQADPAAGDGVIEPPASLPAVAPAPSGAAESLQRLIQARKVQELRTTYNGSFGASLLFEPETLGYFVTLFQQKQFWRVVRAQDPAQAEQRYAAFVRETERLAETDLRRLRLEAEVAHAERMLQEKAADLTSLQGDVQRQREQERQVTVRQAQARQEAEQLAAQRAQAREQLQTLQREIRALENQQSASPPRRGR